MIRILVISIGYSHNVWHFESASIRHAPFLTFSVANHHLQENLILTVASYFLSRFPSAINLDLRKIIFPVNQNWYTKNECYIFAEFLHLSKLNQIVSKSVILGRSFVKKLISGNFCLAYFFYKFIAPYTFGFGIALVIASSEDVRWIVRIFDTMVLRFQSYGMTHTVHVQ